mmetsp:Transcript_126764/g.253429  ORF Transcript_126764/g.253429 Transcript_126764/m.253429 type:complete len:153 (+) Transcript_126764:1821-2279(+)
MVMDFSFSVASIVNNPCSGGSEMENRLFYSSIVAMLVARWAGTLAAVRDAPLAPIQKNSGTVTWAPYPPLAKVFMEAVCRRIRLWTILFSLLWVQWTTGYAARSAPPSASLLEAGQDQEQLSKQIKKWKGAAAEDDEKQARRLARLEAWTFQ